MKHYPCLKKVALGFSMMGGVILAGQALAGSWGAPTMGDSTSLEGWPKIIDANVLDPSGSGSETSNTNGLDSYRAPVVAHTPTGQYYSVQWMEPEPAKTMTGSIEIGGMYTSGDNKSSTGGSNKFNEYSDMSNGVFINHFDFSANDGSKTQLNADGGGVGRTDQYYSLQFGQDNDWNVRGSFDEDDHIYSETMRSIYTGVGTDPER
jgi:hypothetical protein